MKIKKLEYILHRYNMYCTTHFGTFTYALREGLYEAWIATPDNNEQEHIGLAKTESGIREICQNNFNEKLRNIMDKYIIQ